MKMSEAFPSAYLKSTDIGDNPVTHIMDKVTMEEVGQEREKLPVLHFQTTDKSLVLNKTNANAITALYGDDTMGWNGRSIELFVIQTEFAGKVVPGIRVRAAKAQGTSPLPKNNMVDSIPF